VRVGHRGQRSVAAVAHQWQPEAVVDEDLARSLVHGQFAPVGERSVELVAAGWDYTVHRVDGEWAFRFPRREIVLEPMRRELAALEQLGPSLPVPAPRFRGEPSERFPWPFWGARWLPGEEAGGATDDERHLLAPQLGRLLRRLHRTEVPGLPVDVVRRADMSFRVPKTREELTEAAALWTPPPEVFGLLDRAERLPPAPPRATCHGDLHFRQLLVDGGRLTGVVDWVDVCRADPGIDLQIVYAYLPTTARGAFFAEYGDVAEESLVRARVVALNLSAVLARYGREQGLPHVEREAIASLDRAVAD
jgi:aminoglycoside phosphotransferase (APT) family kinase protein